VLGLRLDSMILKVFSNLNDSMTSLLQLAKTERHNLLPLRSVNDLNPSGKCIHFPKLVLFEL